MRRTADKASPRDRIWKRITRDRKPFSLRVLADALQLDRKTVSDYLKALERGGYLTRIQRAVLALDDLYDLTDLAGPRAPRLRSDGSEVEQGRGTENMWRTMQRRRSFTLRELVALCNTGDVTVSETTAKTYVGHLMRAGYVRIEKNGRAGGVGGSVYALVRDTGPQAPVIQRIKRVYDPNTRMVHGIDAEGAE